jgi:hypothetical protein
MNIQSTLFPGISPQLDQALRNCDRMTDVSAFEATLHGFHLQTSNEKMKNKYTCINTSDQLT